MRKALNVGEASFELRKDFENAFRIVFDAETFGDLLRILVWASHISNRLRRKHIGFILSATILMHVSFSGCPGRRSHSSFFSGSLGSAFSIGLRGSIWSRMAAS